MPDGRPNESSIFETQSIEQIYDEIKRVYKQYPQPWVIGYSGGKDSTATLQLVWKAIATLPLEDRQKEIFVIASDTQVETPLIVNYIDDTLQKVNEAAAAQKMPFKAQKVVPTLSESFWVNLIGRGYPAPTSRFRWCTERMKINPANRFIQQTAGEYGEVIVVLGVRKTESATRMQLMNTYQSNGHALRRHTSLPGAYVYAPISDFSTDDVWTYLLQVSSPWGSNNRDLAALYRNASAGECPLVIDNSTASCGNSRFGCWVCTVATRDTSMEALIDSGEEWLEPLYDFREWLVQSIDPNRKREFREIKGRDGRVILKKDGTPAARTYKFETSKLMLDKLLRAQRQIQEAGPNPSLQLISEEELHEIRRIWRTERQDWEDCVPTIYHSIYHIDLNWIADDDVHYGPDDLGLLQDACEEFGVPFELVAKLLEVERRSAGMARRANILNAISSVLNEEWRSEEEIVGEGAPQPSLV